MESGVETCTRATLSSLSLLVGSVWVGPCWRRRWTRCCPCWPENPFPVSSRPASCRGRRSSPAGRRRTPAARPDCPCRTRYAPESHAEEEEEEEGGWWQETYTSWCDRQVSHNATPLWQDSKLLMWFRQTWRERVTHFIEERMSGHVEDVHFDFSVANLHSDHTTHTSLMRYTHTLLMRTLHTVIDYLNHELTWWRRSRCQSWPSTWEQTSSHSSVWWCSSERKWFIMMYFTPDFIDKSINLKVECKLKCGGVALTTIVYI